MTKTRRLIRVSILAVSGAASIVALPGCQPVQRDGRGAIVFDDYRPRPRGWLREATGGVSPSPGRATRDASRPGDPGIPDDVAESMVARANRVQPASPALRPVRYVVVPPQPRPGTMPPRVQPGFDPTT